MAFMRPAVRPSSPRDNRCPLHRIDGPRETDPRGFCFCLRFLGFMRPQALPFVRRSSDMAGGGQLSRYPCNGFGRRPLPMEPVERLSSKSRRVHGVKTC